MGIRAGTGCVFGTDYTWTLAGILRAQIPLG